MAIPAEPPAKRPKTKNTKAGFETGTSTPHASPLQEQIAAIEASLSNSTNLNPLYDLIHLLKRYAEPGHQETVALQKAIKFLVRSLQALVIGGRIPLTHVNDHGLVQGSFLPEANRSAADKAVADWLRKRWNEATQLLCLLLSHEESEIRGLALSSLMALQRDASSQLHAQLSISPNSSSSAQWSSSPWSLFMSTLLTSTEERAGNTPDDILGSFVADYLQQYDDVRYAFCREVDHFLRNPPGHVESCQTLRANALAVLWGLTAIPVQEDDLNTYLVKDMEGGKKTGTKAPFSKKAANGTGDGQVENEEMEDWFSDSDEEGGKAKYQNATGLGKAAQRAVASHTAKRQRKRNPPFGEAVVSLGAQKAMFSRAWLAVLLPLKRRNGDGLEHAIGGSFSLAMMHETLLRMHSQIIPHLVKPNLLHDFLTDCLDAGGATSLLALNALYSLMTTHNLNYPAFYPKLYALLLTDPPILHVRYRSRFLRLLDVFLSSTHLPAALVASFAKRLSRAALRAPPAAAVVIIPFVWNLCKRHKQCLQLLHREFGGDRFDAGPAGVNDPFDESITDPLKTNAIDSSLWELAALGSGVTTSQSVPLGSTIQGGDMHYLASVSSLSKILAEPFTKERYDLEDFLDLTYGTLFETEMAKTLANRERKKPIAAPALVYALPNLNGKRLPLFGNGRAESAREERIENKKVEQVFGEEDDGDKDLRNAKLAMQEVPDSTAAMQEDACARFFSFF